ncbi:MAG: type II toxin-antitoxin system HicB family antitoxin [Candidatus Omnitrophica bacterium]|nr:type II toxin-antitoxin system HicB family antitoxin [Candidatus Omnitrophota bacterium]
MRKFPTVLRCYARPEGEDYLAFCVDLRLCDRGETLEAARASLEEDILGYLESLTPERMAALFPRPAPWYVYVDYARVRCLVALARLFHQVKHRFLIFAEPLVVTPRLAHGVRR